MNDSSSIATRSNPSWPVILAIYTYKGHPYSFRCKSTCYPRNLFKRIWSSSVCHRLLNTADDFVDTYRDNKNTSRPSSSNWKRGKLIWPLLDPFASNDFRNHDAIILRIFDHRQHELKIHVSSSLYRPPVPELGQISPMSRARSNVLNSTGLRSSLYRSSRSSSWEWFHWFQRSIRCS